MCRNPGVEGSRRGRCDGGRSGGIGLRTGWDRGWRLREKHGHGSHPKSREYVGRAEVKAQFK